MLMYVVVMIAIWCGRYGSNVVNIVAMYSSWCLCGRYGSCVADIVMQFLYVRYLLKMACTV